MTLSLETGLLTVKTKFRVYTRPRRHVVSVSGESTILKGISIDGHGHGHAIVNSPKRVDYTNQLQRYMSLHTNVVGELFEQARSV
jgi:hypothetical protein